MNFDFGRCARNAPSIEKLPCKSKECKIFDKSVSDVFDWSHENFPNIEALIDVNSKSFYPKVTDTEYTLHVSGFDDSTNGCFDITYYVTEGAELQIRYNNRKVFELPTTKYNINSMIDQTSKITTETEKFCIRDFVMKPSAEFNISFYAKFSEGHIVAIKLNLGEFKLTKDSLKSPIPFIVQNNYTEEGLSDDYNFDNQWRIKFPSRIWKFEEKNAKKFLIILNGNILDNSK